MMIDKSHSLAVPWGRVLVRAFLLGAVLQAAPLSTAKDGWRTYCDDELGFEISYPMSYHFSQDPALLQGASDAGAEKLGDDYARRHRFAFFVFLYEPGSVAFNPNLNLSVEQIPDAPVGLTTEGYYRGSLATLARSGFRLQGDEPAKVMIGRREFYQLDGTLTAYGEEIRTRVYFHYDPETRRAYNLNLVDLAADAEENFASLEAVVETVRFVEQ